MMGSSDQTRTTYDLSDLADLTPVMLLARRGRREAIEMGDALEVEEWDAMESAITRERIARFRARLAAGECVGAEVTR